MDNKSLNNIKIIKQHFHPFLWGTGFIIFSLLDFKDASYDTSKVFLIVGFIFFIERFITLMKNKSKKEIFLQELIENIFMMLIFISAFFTFIILSINKYEYIYFIWTIAIGIGYFITGWIIENKLNSMVGSLAVILSICLIVFYKHLNIDTFIKFSRYIGIIFIGFGSYIIEISLLRERNNDNR